MDSIRKCGGVSVTAASPSPVSSAKDAWSWLEGKGWLLNSEDSTSIKLLNILLSATHSFKLPVDANTAMCSVAFLLQAHSDKMLASTVADQLIDEVINKINDLIAKLNDSISSTKNS